MLIKNGRVFYNGMYHDEDVRIRDGVIAEIGIGLVGDEETIDAAGKLVYAGFLDTHIHGCNGGECSDSTEAVIKASELLPKFGVTGYLPTFSLPDADTVRTAVRNIRAAKGCPGAEVLGMHIDSPFRYRSIAYYPVKVPPTREYTLDMVDGDLSDIRIISVAPELPGSMEWLDWVVKEGVIGEIGHTECTADQVKEAADHGATLLNHFYNGYAPMDHHVSGVLAGGLIEDRLFAQLTCDGIHVAEAFIKLTVRAKGIHKVVPVTDCSQFLGMPEGRYMRRDKEVIFKDGAARDPNGKLVTGAHPYDENMRTIRAMGFTLEEVGTMFAENPAISIGESKRGKIEVGRKGDLVIMDTDLFVKQTIMDGKVVYAAE
ncbi:MAG: hypothetical protein E7328_00670 [Clostridiales bacterium]|nr:hypothetical protein [Clostridiales bacterium]